VYKKKAVQPRVSLRKPHDLVAQLDREHTASGVGVVQEGGVDTKFLG